MIKTTNDMNRDFGFDKPVITKEGILQDKVPECRALLDRIELDMDMAWMACNIIKELSFLNMTEKLLNMNNFLMQQR